MQVFISGESSVKKLTQLLEENKITEDEFNLLSKTLQNSKISSKFKWSFFINPFERISGYQAFFSGILIILGMCSLAVNRNDNFPGLIDYNYAPFNYTINTKYKITYSLVIYQNLVACIVLILLYYFFSKFYKQKGLRIIDFVGTVTLARFPLFVQSILGNIMAEFNPSYQLLRRSPHESIWSIIGWIYVIACFAWLISTYFYALKESSGLSGKKLWISFVSSLIAGEIICAILTRIFFPAGYHL